jgi:glyoxylase I family protein
LKKLTVGEEAWNAKAISDDTWKGRRPPIALHKRVSGFISQGGRDSDRQGGTAMIIGPEHTAIASRNPERLCGWYVQNLGFSVCATSPTGMMLLAPNGYMLELVAAEGSADEHQIRTPGFRHLAIAVDDFDAEYGRLKAIGTTFESEPMVSGGNRVVFFRDPENNYLHLIYRPPVPSN